MRLQSVAVERAPAPVGWVSGTGAPSRRSLVIVGAGMVAHRLCRALVDSGAIDRYAVTVCGEERLPAYDRVHLTSYLAGRDPDSLLLSPREWYEDHGIELVLGDPVVAIDRRARSVGTAAGMEIPYDRLVLATGSSPYVPPIDGARQSGVFMYRTLDDLDRIRDRARRSAHAAVIGGGLLGLEAARALQRLGLTVWVVEVAGALMPAQLDQQGSDLLAAAIERLGIHVLTGTRTTAIEASGASWRLRFTDGRHLDVDLVVVATGVRPRSELATACGLACTREGAIAVDRRLQTSDSRIHAIGECASYGSQTWGLVAPGYAMADALAANLAGHATRFSYQSPAMRLKLLGVEVASVGPVLHGGVSLVFAKDGCYRRLRLERGRLVAAFGVGAWPDFGRIQDGIARSARVWPWQATRFERTGSLERASDVTTPVATWPGDAVVCNCFGVTRGQLTAARAAGCTTIAALAARTGASTLCGSCRPLLDSLVGTTPAAPPRPAWGLIAVSAAAAVATALIVTASPIALSATLEAGSSVEVLWRDSAVRQASGFTLLGTCAASALLTARKRIRRLSVGSFGMWRTLHGLVGVLALGLLAVHTGLRLGSNLTMALAIAFLAANAVGALAGSVTGAPAREDARRRGEWRRAAVFAHIAAIGPLPILIAFHVLAVYYF